MRTGWLWLVPAASLLVGGCGQGMGYLIKPVPVKDDLVERTVSSDPGLFVSDKIVVVDVDGLLLNQRGGGLLGPHENPVSLFVEKMDKAQKDPGVRAMVLRINSPGGGVTASDLLYRRLAEFKKESQAPVVAVIEDVGASGAYYLACGADTIMVAPTSVTGSIGVIVQTFSLSGTLAKLGIDTKAVTSGPMKDMASPLKPLSAEDQKVLQEMVTEFYGRFVDVVAAGRPKMNRDQVKALADGRVYTGVQAVARGLADATGDVKDAVAEAKKRSGSKAAKVVMYDRPWGYKANVYSAAPVGGMQINLLNISVPELMTWLEPQFLYLWTGGAGGTGSGGL
jgi:protease-4